MVYWLLEDDDDEEEEENDAAKEIRIMEIVEWLKDISQYVEGKGKILLVPPKKK